MLVTSHYVHVIIKGAEVTALIVRGVTTGLTHQQQASGAVPWFQSQFPVAFIATGGQPCEVQSGGTAAADAGHLWHQAAQYTAKRQAVLSGNLGERNARSEYGFRQFAPGGHTDAPLFRKAPTPFSAQNIS